MNTVLLLVGIFVKSNEQPLFCAILAKMNQRRSFIFGQIVDTCFDHIFLVLTHSKRYALGLLSTEPWITCVLSVAESV